MMAGSRTLMRWIVQTSLNCRVLVVALGALMMVFGVATLPSTRIDAFPEFAPPRVVIQTACLGLSTSDVEQLVTVPLEQALNGVDGLEDMRSKSVPQLSAIELIFSPDVDLLRARQLVQERMTAVSATLPTWAAPPVMLAPVSATGRAMQIGVTSNDHSLIQISMSAYWTIRARLLAVPGVANVALWGERLQMMQVQVEPPKMAAQQVALNDVMEATADAVDSGLLRFSNGSIIGTGGTIESSNQRLSVRNVLPIITPDDLAKVPFKEATKQRPPTRIGDVAHVVEDHQPLIGDAVIDDDPGLLLVVEKLPWANTVELTRGVEEAIRSLEPGLPGVQFDTTIFQQANFIQEAIHNLTQALILGFVLVVVILALFLFEWRVALISLLTIPLSLMATLLVLHWRGETINTMTLAGLVIALGAVVDDAIIDVENIVRRLRQHRLSGAGGPLALSYTLAIVASMIVAMTVTPALTLLLLRGGGIERRQSPLVVALQRGYTAALSRIINRPRWAYVLVGVVTVAGAAIVPLLGQSLFPAFKERDFLIHWVTQPGTSAAEMQRSTIEVGKRLREIPGVRNFGAHIGQAFLGEEVAGVNLGEAWISIDPSVDYQETLDRIEAVTEPYPGLFRETQTYLDERIEEVISGGKEPIVVRVFGEDLNVLRAKAEEINKILAGIEGIEDQHVDVSTDVPQIQVEVNLPKATRPGSSPAMYAGRPQHSTPERRSETSSVPARRTTSWSGAHRRRETVCSTLRTCRWTPRTGNGCVLAMWRT